MTTNVLGMVLPSVGSSSDTWGDQLNTAFTTVDAMLARTLWGLELSAAGGTGTFGIAVGGVAGMTLASAYTKTTNSWAVGTGNGALDTGAIANSTTYHVWLIQRSDTLVVDVLISLSSSAPTMPANYDRKFGPIMAMITDGSAQWKLFSQRGDEVLWGTPVLDFSSVTPPNTSAALKALSVPIGGKTEALFDLELDYASASVNLYVSSPDQTDVAATTSASTLFVSSTATLGQKSCRIRTSTAGQIRVRASNVGCAYFIQTNGFIHPRGKI